MTNFIRFSHELHMIENLFLKTHIFTILIFATILLGFLPAYAHTSDTVGPYEIEIGWEEEPPVVGLLNFLTFEITEPGEVKGVKTGVTNAFRDMQVTIKFGGVSKTLDIISDPRPGHYKSKIIPTKTGTVVLEFDGELNGEPVDLTFNPEAIESSAVLDFPPKHVSGSGEELLALKNAIQSMRNDVSRNTKLLEGFDPSAGDYDVALAYNFGVFGLSLGAAGVILGIIAMLKRR